MTSLGLEHDVIDPETYRRTVDWFRSAGVLLPTFAQLAAPDAIPAAIREPLKAVDPDRADPGNLFRVHWYNDRDRAGQAAVPAHVVLPAELTGVDAKIVVALGDLFPMVRAHKVLPAYACLVPRIVTGTFDPARDRAVWPSTGNYCRGGVAISRLLGCRGVAVLPEGMSRERFAWLEDWVTDPGDIIRTPGTESNVKEIYDKCAELAADPGHVIFNQFAEFGNHLVHYQCTGRALEAVFDSLAEAEPGLRLRAFVSASGSAGTLGAGDYLKERYAVGVVRGRPGPGVPPDPAPRPRAGAGRADRLRPVQRLQHPGRGEDREVPAPRPGRRDHHGGHRRGRDVRQRARAHRRPRLPGRLRCRRRGRGVRPLDARDRARGPAGDHATGTASSTSATTPGSSSRGCHWPTSRRGAISGSGPACATCCPCGTP